MGQYMSYPLQQEVICYHRRQDYDHCGNKKQIADEVNELDLLHRQFCADIFKQRMKTSERRKLLTDVSNDSYAARFPNWDHEDIGDFKIQFEVFDLNRDGLIDFKELNIDDANAIDFEEFLQLLYSLQTTTAKNEFGGNLGNIVTRGAQQVKTLRRMSVYKQLTNGMF